MTKRSRPMTSPSTLWNTMLALGLALYAGAAAAQETHPVRGGAPYSAGVVSPPGATLAVLGGITGHGADVASASTDALSEMDARLAEIGLDRSHVLRVRAALAPRPDGGADFSGWNDAWTDFFAGTHLPARTSIGSSGLPDDALVVLDVVAMFPPGTGYPAPVDAARSTPNPNLRLAGPSENPTAVVSTRSGLVLSSGALADLDGLEDPSSMEEQMRSAMTDLTGRLGDHGLRWHDAFYVRVLPTPQPDRASPDFAAWRPVRRTLGEVTAGHGPPFTMWAAPGFSSSGRFVEVEVWAVPPSQQPAFATYDREAANPLLRMSGSETSSIASVATIGPNAELLWISGVIAPDGTAPEDEAAGALANMRNRLEAMGASMSDVAELRVYRVAGEADADLGGAWNEAYGTEFNNPDLNPHKPVRTNYLVESLPAGRHVEVEAVIVRPPKGF